MKKTSLFRGVVIASLFMLWSGASFCLAEDNRGNVEKLLSKLVYDGDDNAGTITSEENARYVPNELIVKFKAEAAGTLEREISQKGTASGMAASASSLNCLGKQHRVKKIVPLFKNFKKDRERLNLIKHKGYLKEKLTSQETHLLKRLERAPKNPKIPDLDRIYKLELEDGLSVEEAAAEYSKDPNVEYAEPNGLCYVEYQPNDSLYSSQWAHRNVQSELAWDIERGDSDVIIAVVDTGIDYNHEDLNTNIWLNSGEIPNNGICICS